MPRYVILLHELPAGHERSTHWDLMLERGGSLRTWALDREPTETFDGDARELAEHRLDYLDYEGAVSGNRGHVTRWDEGEYTLESESPERLTVVLNGRRLHARVTLARRAGATHSWRVSFSAEPTRG